MLHSINSITPADIKPLADVRIKIDLHLQKAMKTIAKRYRKQLSVVYQEAIELYLNQPEQYGWNSKK